MPWQIAFGSLEEIPPIVICTRYARTTSSQPYKESAVFGNASRLHYTTPDRAGWSPLHARAGSFGRY